MNEADTTYSIELLFKLVELSTSGKALNIYRVARYPSLSETFQFVLITGYHY